jgi:curved DNA-binding protein CbpA
VTHYEVLGLEPGATTRDVEQAYRKLISKMHPDLGTPPALFRQLREAFETLSDPHRRRAYDQLLAGGASVGGTPNIGAELEAKMRDALPSRAQVVSAAKDVGGAFVDGLVDNLMDRFFGAPPAPPTKPR